MKPVDINLERDRGVNSMVLVSCFGNQIDAMVLNINSEVEISFLQN